MERKFDEDFLFYLSFVNNCLRTLTDNEMEQKCKIWLQKLCGENYQSVQQKRCRNIYLANLLVCMQNKELDPVFLKCPKDVNVIDALEVFTSPSELETPSWLENSDFLPVPSESNAGRTYFATRALPNEQGAMAYIGLSLGNEVPMWMGAGEGNTFDEHLQEKYQQEVPPTHEMEKILARRKDPRERERVLTFYDVLMQNIADELDEKSTEENPTVEGLLQQLIDDLKEHDRYAEFEALEENARRVELLIMLFERVQVRRERIAKREEYLDDLEERVMPKSFFESSVLPQDKYEFPAAMWEQAINKVPTMKVIERLQAVYPVLVIERFLKLLTDYKEEIAMRMQRRHENLATQMKKELRKEGERKELQLQETQNAYDLAARAHKLVSEHYKKQQMVENKNEDVLNLSLPEHSKAYEALRAAVLDTQTLVEEESEMGKFLSKQITAVNAQTEQIMHVSEEMIEKTEEANTKILKNIRRLKGAIKQYESRISVMQSTIDGTKQGSRAYVF